MFLSINRGKFLGMVSQLYLFIIKTRVFLNFTPALQLLNILFDARKSFIAKGKNITSQMGL